MLIKYAKREGPRDLARELRLLSSRRYLRHDGVDAALEPVQPRWPRDQQVSRPESDLPPGCPKVKNSVVDKLT